MAGPELTVVALQDGDVAALLALLPTAAGVAQVQGPEGQSLLIGRPANLRRWAATHLGAGPPPRKKGMRPPTNLAPVTTAVAYAAATSAFAQRLAFERVMARHVPLSRRRDLKPPVYVHLDPSARFPRLTVRSAGREPGHLFGPFRSRQAAQAAIETVHRRFPLRPCDYTFEPSPDLALGLGCLFAQVGSCAAPCLVRTTEEDYRALAGRAVEALSGAAARPPEWRERMPEWVRKVADARAVVVERGRRGVELYPVVAAAVVEEEMVLAREDGLQEGLGSLRWSAPPEPRDDLPWLLPWLHGKRSGLFLPLAEGEALSEVAERARPPGGTSPPRDG
ncbi:MAG TPA: hypothetical protein VMR21_03440 [Vicinamibacteria bacterium]|nr:hypothetical protein [Vicinamibacteria bacterium]